VRTRASTRCSPTPSAWPSRASSEWGMWPAVGGVSVQGYMCVCVGGGGGGG
jgi:hypothetical protein